MFFKSKDGPCFWHVLMTLLGNVILYFDMIFLLCFLLLTIKEGNVLNLSVCSGEGGQADTSLGRPPSGTEL